MSKPLISPHGGTLVDRVLTGSERDDAVKRARNLRRSLSFPNAIWLTSSASLRDLQPARGFRQRS